MKAGRIHTFKIFVNAEVAERKVIEALKQLDMTARPTHWTNSGSLVDEEYIDVSATQDQKTGVEPGMEIK